MKTNTSNSGLLYFTRSERNGIVLFTLFCLLIFWLPSQFSSWKTPTETDFSTFQQEIAVFESRQTKPLFQQGMIQADTIDPNTATAEQLMAIGLPERTAHTIIKYREKGGDFRYKEDLRKMYTIDEATYERIVPYLKLPAKPSFQKPKTVLVKKKIMGSPAPFDPNTATRETLLQLEIPAKVVNTMINYRSKGGVFRKKEDLQKVYGLTDELYERLAPLIKLSEAIEKNKIRGYERKEPPSSLDINTASAEEWRSLPGIGPAYSARIVKFRDKLGGFAKVAQVAETYGLPDSTFQKIEHILIASPIQPTLKINRCSVEELQAHPYISWRQAKAIVNYRIQNGPIQDLENFADLRALSKELKLKLEPYLSFE